MIKLENNKFTRSVRGSRSGFLPRVTHVELANLLDLFIYKSSLLSGIYKSVIVENQFPT